MSLKILGGMAKGLNLDTPESELTRPTSVMLRRKIFDAHQNLSQFIFYDLCAGSGMMGFEALSRGAEKIYLVESHRLANKFIQKNLMIMAKNIPNIEQVVVHSQWDVFRFLENEKNNLMMNSQKTILYFDPPYADSKLYLGFYQFLSTLENFQGEIWIEACEQKTQAEALNFPSFLHEIKRYNHSHHFIAIFRMK